MLGLCMRHLLECRVSGETRKRRRLKGKTMEGRDKGKGLAPQKVP